jgi:hypothetical protein
MDVSGPDAAFPAIEVCQPEINPVLTCAAGAGLSIVNKIHGDVFKTSYRESPSIFPRQFIPLRI